MNLPDKSEKSAKNPSIVTDVYWLWAKNTEMNYPAPSPRNGKWLIFVYQDNIDEVWRKIRRAIKQGELGSSAKVSTARPNPNAQKLNTHVICVYTYDSDDTADVMRIRRKLRELGILQKIPYKTDQATLAGRYVKRGHKKVSKYFE